MGKDDRRAEASQGDPACSAAHACEPAYRLGARRGYREPPDRPSNPTVTLTVYAHLFGNTDDRAAAAVETALAGLLTE